MFITVLLLYLIHHYYSFNFCLLCFNMIYFILLITIYFIFICYHLLLFITAFIASFVTIYSRGMFITINSMGKVLDKDFETSLGPAEDDHFAVTYL